MPDSGGGKQPPRRRRPPSPLNLTDFFALRRDADADAGAPDNAHASDVDGGGVFEGSTSTITSPLTGMDVITDLAIVREFSARVMRAEAEGLLVPLGDAAGRRAERLRKRRKTRCHVCARKIPLVLQASVCSCGFRFCDRHFERPQHDCACVVSQTQTPGERVVADKLTWRV